MVNVLANVKAALSGLLGQGHALEAIRAAAEELAVDRLIEDLQRSGHLAADPETVAYARVQAQADPDGFANFMRQARPLPAQPPAVTINPTAQADDAEAAIQARMQQTGEPYHEAATAVSAGGVLRQ